MHSVGLITKNRAGRWVAPPMTADRIRDLCQLRWLLQPAALVQSIPHIPAASIAQACDAPKSTLASLASASSQELDKLEEDLHIGSQPLIRPTIATRLIP